MAILLIVVVIAILLIVVIIALLSIVVIIAIQVVIAAAFVPGPTPKRACRAVSWSKWVRYEVCVLFLFRQGRGYERHSPSSRECEARAFKVRVSDPRSVARAAP